MRLLAGGLLIVLALAAWKRWRVQVDVVRPVLPQQRAEYLWIAQLVIRKPSSALTNGHASGKATEPSAATPNGRTDS